jgi:predicted O-methyltransferase YrrM
MFLPEGIEQYLYRLTPERPPVLREMEEHAAAHHFPIIGPLVGRLLYQMALITSADRVLELGSGFGYSAYWFSMALGERGLITMIDGSDDNRAKAEEYFQRGGIQTPHEFHVGDALTVLKDIDGPFDIVLNDIDKEGYPDTLDPVAARLRPGGVFITDNLLWSGRILDQKPDAATRGVVEFARRLYADERFVTTIVPLRDGVSVAVRR